MPEKLYTPEEVAEMLSVKPTTIREWLKVGTLKGVKLPNRMWRITEDDLNDFIQKSKSEK